MNDAARARDAIDQVEEAYEFMLAYAAQGRQDDGDTSGASQIREYLGRAAKALGVLADATDALFPANSPGAAFAARFADDLAVARSILELLLAREAITSDMIDNTNGLIAVRALLTDLFFIDQAVLPPR